MVPANDFLPFCPTDTGSNLLSESDYLASTGRTSGNVPGVASSKLNNKALRQASYIAATVAQLIANQTGTDVLDDATPGKILAQISAALTPIARIVTAYTATGAATHNCTLFFYTATANATAGATYTNNGHTYTVTKTIAGAILLQVTGNAAPTASGTLTKASGTGDATITFYAVRTPVQLRVRLVGAGGGGGGGGAGGSGAGADGADTVFGTSTAGHGFGNTKAGGTNTVGAGHTAILNIAGGSGCQGGAWAGTATGNFGSAMGGVSGLGAPGGAFGTAAAANSGSGGAGGTAGNLVNASANGSGGGAGGFLELLVNYPALTYALTVGAGGAGGTAGTSGGAGGAGANGQVVIEELF